MKIFLKINNNPSKISCSTHKPFDSFFNRKLLLSNIIATKSNTSLSAKTHCVPAGIQSVSRSHKIKNSYFKSWVCGLDLVILSAMSSLFIGNQKKYSKITIYN